MKDKVEHDDIGIVDIGGYDKTGASDAGKHSFAVDYVLGTAQCHETNGNDLLLFSFHTGKNTTNTGFSLNISYLPASAFKKTPLQISCKLC